MSGSYQGMPPAPPNKDAVRPTRRFRSTDFDPVMDLHGVPQRGPKPKPEKVIPFDAEYERWRQDMLFKLYHDTGVFDEATVPIGKGSRGA